MGFRSHWVKEAFVIDLLRTVLELKSIVDFIILIFTSICCFVAKLPKNLLFFA